MTGIDRTAKPFQLWLGLTILLVVALSALCAPLLSPHDPTAQNLARPLGAPSREHPLGTDHLGRDVLARLLYAGQVDLAVAISAVIAPFVLGTGLGLLAGYLRGCIDAVVGRLVDVATGFPPLVLLVALVSALDMGYGSVLLAAAATGWASYTRIVRAETLLIRQQEYVAAAQAAGLSDLRVIIRHVAPNVITRAIVYCMSDAVLIMVGLATLGYLGVGIQASTLEWGAMIADGQPYVLGHWHLVMLPGVAITLVGLAFSLIGDGLNDLLSRR